MNKLLLIIIGLSSIIVNAQKPHYSKVYKYDGIPINYSSLHSYVPQSDSMTNENTVNNPEDIIYEPNNTSEMNPDEISKIIQFQNIYDNIRLDPMTINMNQQVEYIVLGSFDFHDNTYLIYNIDYNFNGFCTIIALMNKDGGYPSSLIISGGNQDARYLTFNIHPEDNKIEISRLFCFDNVYKKISYFKLSDFKFIENKYQINYRYSIDSIYNANTESISLDIDQIEGWMDFDWSDEAYSKFLRAKQFQE